MDSKDRPVAHGKMLSIRRLQESANQVREGLAHIHEHPYVRQRVAGVAGAWRPQGLARGGRAPSTHTESRRVMPRRPAQLPHGEMKTHPHRLVHTRSRQRYSQQPKRRNRPRVRQLMNG